jgi:hypothetical protein
MNKLPIARFAIGIWFLSALPAFAGMTVIGLSDIARARIDALSFFIATYLLISWVVKLLWNHLGKTFSALPRLDYRRALGLVFVTGLMFYVVLTMISGARELLTPGAWEKQGVGYRIRENGVAALGKEERRGRLRELQIAIWSHAKNHDGKAPSGPFADGIASPLWEYPGGGLYCLMPGVKPGGGRDIFVYEPSAAGARRFVLLADGSIEDFAEGELKRRIDSKIGK